MTSSAASKSTLTKNSNNSNNNNDTDGLNTNSDEPPVLSRCPSPLYVSYDDDDDDDDNNNTIHYCAVEQSKFSKKKNKMYCTNKKSSSTTRHRHRPMRKKLKYFANTSPPRLVKNVLEPVRQTSSSIGKMLRSKLMKSNKDKNACRRSNEAHRNKSFKCNEKLRRGKSKDDGIGDVKQQNFNNNDEEDDEDDGDSLSCKKKMAHTDDYLELTNNNIMPELVKNVSQPSSSSSPIATSSPSHVDPSSSDKEMPNLITETCFIESNAKHDDDGAKVSTKCHQKSNPITKLNNAGSKKGERTTNDNVAAYVDAADRPGAADETVVGSKKMEENGDAMDSLSCSRDVDDYDDDDIMIDCEEVEISTEDGDEDEEKGGESEMATAICNDANGDTNADDCSIIKMIGPGIICDKTVGNKNNKRCFVEREDEDVDDEETDDDHHAKKKIKLDVASSSLSSLLSSSSFSSLLSSSSSSLFSLSTSLSPSASCHSVICIKAPNNIFTFVFIFNVILSVFAIKTQPTSLTPKLTPPLPPPTSGLWLTTVNQHFFSTSVTSSVAITPTFIQLNGTTTSATDANLLRTTASTAATASATISATATRLPRSLSSPPVEFMLKSAHVIIEKLNHLKSPSLPSSPSLSSATSTAAADDAAPVAAAAADDNEDRSR
ncbi:hypothetical protein HELRODRAFT_175123 [Helobdella robusta]|uniref:Uncharacterized protein n=1 Tax=Helobdella robusta TaxID=6412 RepID=T1F8V9_HELRO|nr:hypothetical protein HELRODRAFT_175123 [Helobdella robusta]ESO01094.1 hypothetical protein HELRODRAFT_175123 [Helobdella robusta]